MLKCFSNPAGIGALVGCFASFRLGIHAPTVMRFAESPAWDAGFKTLVVFGYAALLILQPSIGCLFGTVVQQLRIRKGAKFDFVGHPHE